jgi:hypothetical protein
MFKTPTVHFSLTKLYVVLQNLRNSEKLARHETIRTGSWKKTGSAPPGAFWRQNARSGLLEG